MTQFARITLPLLLAAGLTLACNDKSKSASASSSSAAAQPATGAATVTAADAKKYFTQKCEVCHGTTGKGDGVGAASLEPKPRAFGDDAWQASVTDEHIEKVIVGGGAAVGKSPVMPPAPDLKKNEAMLKELVKYIRSFKH
ncbi:MAG: c-type cytochrome [Polyangiaceae bacterium]|nr:c-type cytochrome [Polyangiaceae bacterium]